MALYPNGRAPESALVTYRGCKASPDMARRVAWVEREYMRRNPGGYITPNEIYRDYDSQIYWLNYWSARGLPGNAATPGYSNHGDWDVGAVDWDCDNIPLRDELARKVGLVRTIASESWHYAVRFDPEVDLSGFAADGESTPLEIPNGDPMFLYILRSSGESVNILGTDFVDGSTFMGAPGTFRWLWDETSRDAVAGELFPGVKIVELDGAKMQLVANLLTNSGTDGHPTY